MLAALMCGSAGDTSTGAERARRLRSFFSFIPEQQTYSVDAALAGSLQRGPGKPASSKAFESTRPHLIAEPLLDPLPIPRR